MDQFIIIGLIAGFFTSLGAVPQIIKGYLTKKMEDVSIFMPVVLVIGMTLWLAYGIILEDIPIVLWNAVSVVLNSVMILMKLYYSKYQGGMNFISEGPPPS